MTQEEIMDFLRRSYTAVDGLWFVKAEERYGFDAALDLDEEVWKVFPKIQVRMLKAIAKADGGCHHLSRCLSTKLAIEDFGFHAEMVSADRLDVVITRCPWHALMVKSGRQNLSGDVGTRICRTEYSVWAAEFACQLDFAGVPHICTGGESCVLKFSNLT